jgi:hypothetical protein
MGGLAVAPLLAMLGHSFRECEPVMSVQLQSLKTQRIHCLLDEQQDDSVRSLSARLTLG